MGEPYVAVRRQTREFQPECQALARRIEAWRKFHGLSMRQLRKHSDVPISRLSDIKNKDRADLKFTTILRIAKGIGIPAQRLIFEDPPAR